MGTVLGSILDPAADKFLMTTMVVSLTINQMLPIPLAALILGRDAGLSLSAFYFRYISLPAPVRSSFCLLCQISQFAIRTTIENIQTLLGFRDPLRRSETDRDFKIQYRSPTSACRDYDAQSHPSPRYYDSLVLPPMDSRGDDSMEWIKLSFNEEWGKIYKIIHPAPSLFSPSRSTRQYNIASFVIYHRQMHRHHPHSVR